ncbi:MAG: type II toxin-antitoxin system HicA family toxin [Bacteroidetes bacterium]|nr:type II toxin-antitoxin system HicA family toxin [Bacteroidota bacterium]
MSKLHKALDRLKSRPKDFKWQELQTIMRHFGYIEQKKGGSARKFIHQEKKVLISIHEPHPKPILKMYALDIIINHLKEEGLL